MSKSEGLRRVLRASGWSYREIGDLEAAICLMDPTMALAERLCSTMFSLAAHLGRQMHKGIRRVSCDDGWILGGPDVPGGPSADPGDETLRLFEQ